MGARSSDDRLKSIAGLLLMLAAVVGLMVSHSLFSSSPIVIGAQAVTVVLLLWARLTFGRRTFHAAADSTEGGLVTSGPYRSIRHPIYTAACIFCWAGILARGSVGSIGLGGLLVLGALSRMLAEERLLLERYPDYRLYAQVTKRMVPYLF